MAGSVPEQSKLVNLASLRAATRPQASIAAPSSSWRGSVGKAVRAGAVTATLAMAALGSVGSSAAYAAWYDPTTWADSAPVAASPSEPASLPQPAVTAEQPALKTQAAPMTREQQQAVKTLQSVDLLNHPLQPGDRGDAVRRLKDGVAVLEPSLKASPQFASNAYDSDLTQAVQSYQTQKGLAPSGKVDEMTMGVAFHDLFWNHNTTLNLIDPSVYDALPPLKVSVNTGPVQAGGQRVSLETLDGQVIKQFPTSTGSAKYPTPKGQFEIQSITERPSWNPPNSPWAAGAHKTGPGPNNPVGNVKMNVVGAVYLHGVPPKEYGSIGKSAQSHGCMRMFQSDAWQLHDIIQKGTSVTIH